MGNLPSGVDLFKLVDSVDEAMESLVSDLDSDK